MTSFDGLRHLFELPERDGISVAYLCGHSLGLQPTATRSVVEAELARWSELAVEGHFGPDGWYDLAERLTPAVAQLAGALTSEVALANTLTANLHFLMASFYRPNGARNKILIETHAFPSDRYAVSTQARWHGLDPVEVVVQLHGDSGGDLLGTHCLIDAIRESGEELALVLLPGVQFLTGERFDIAGVTAAAHEVGATVGWDLAHSFGNVPLALHDDGPDFAAWCHYKYANSGPGAVGGLFVHERHHRADLPRLGGWWSIDPARRFDLPEEFSPRLDAASWPVSNPPILSLAPIGPAVEMFNEVGIEVVHGRSLELADHLVSSLETGLRSRVKVVTPCDSDRRGAQVSVRLAEAPDDLAHRLSDAGVIVDVRKPDLIRMACCGLFNSADDIDRAVAALSAIP